MTTDGKLNMPLILALGIGLIFLAVILGLFFISRAALPAQPPAAPQSTTPLTSFQSYGAQVGLTSSTIATTALSISSSVL